MVAGHQLVQRLRDFGLEQQPARCAGQREQIFINQTVDFHQAGAERREVVEPGFERGIQPLAFREDDDFIWGRGACDVKGIIAAMICAAEELLVSGERGFGLLFVVGEERNSAGALHAARNPRGSRFIVNGEPTENRLAIGGKGALRYEIEARGKMAHSAYPELGESAIDKLLDALERQMEDPAAPGFAVHDHYVARLLDLFDVAGALVRLAVR